MINKEITWLNWLDPRKWHWLWNICQRHFRKLFLILCILGIAFIIALTKWQHILTYLFICDLKYNKPEVLTSKPVVISEMTKVPDNWLKLNFGLVKISVPQKGLKNYRTFKLKYIKQPLTQIYYDSMWISITIITREEHFTFNDTELTKKMQKYRYMDSYDYIKSYMQTTGADFSFYLSKNDLAAFNLAIFEKDIFISPGMKYKFFHTKNTKGFYKHIYEKKDYIKRCIKFGHPVFREKFDINCYDPDEIYIIIIRLSMKEAGDHTVFAERIINGIEINNTFAGDIIHRIDTEMKKHNIKEYIVGELY